jgi:ABC-type uncharacterized transport system substrate-binding protein
VAALISYGIDTIDIHRRAAAYVDRILRARSRPTCRFRPRPKHETVLNLKMAKALGGSVA